MTFMLNLMIPGGSPRTCLARWPNGSRWTPPWRGSTPAIVILLKKNLDFKFGPAQDMRFYILLAMLLAPSGALIAIPTYY